METICLPDRWNGLSPWDLWSRGISLVLNRVAVNTGIYLSAEPDDLNTRVAFRCPVGEWVFDRSGIEDEYFRSWVSNKISDDIKELTLPTPGNSGENPNNRSTP